MKKKVKLFTTIASLCLAVALMAFGVYAATSVTAKVSGKISFTSTDIAGYWTYEATLTGGEFVGKEGAEKTKLSYANDDHSVAYENALPDVKVVTTDDNKTAILTIVATFHNTGDTVEAKLSSTKSDDVTTANKGTLAITTDAATGTAAANNVGTITYTITFIADNLHTSWEANYELNFTANRGA